MACSQFGSKTTGFQRCRTATSGLLATKEFLCISGVGSPSSGSGGEAFLVLAAFWVQLVVRVICRVLGFARFRWSLANVWVLNSPRLVIFLFNLPLSF